MSEAPSRLTIMFRGRILAESLKLDVDLIVPDVRLHRLGRRDVSDSSVSTQPTIWTFLDFEAPDNRAEELATGLAEALSADGGWYADFRSETEHVVIFPGKTFRYAKGDRDGFDAAVEYGRSIGVPDHQLDWEDVDPWAL